MLNDISNEPLEVVVIGSGYVGTVTAVELAKHTSCKVTALDINKEKISRLASGDPCIEEPSLKSDLESVLHKNRIQFTSNPEDCIPNANVVITCVGTPTDESNNVNLSALVDTAKMFGKYCRNGSIFVIKSTVPPNAPRVIEHIIKPLAGDNPIEVITNPEFLKEGTAVHDFIYPERLVFGVSKFTNKDRMVWMMEKMYGKLYHNTKVIWVSRESACLAKYASNAFLATKISFINTIAEIAENNGADVEEVAEIMGTDTRIGEKFLRAGLGFGGSCFPKDLRAINGLTRDDRYNIFDAVIKRNKEQINMVMKKLFAISNWRNKTIGILGLAFKPDTDDIRESQAIRLIEKIHNTSQDTNIIAWDANAGAITNTMFTPVNDYAQLIGYVGHVLNVAQILIITTEWHCIREYVNELECFLDAGGYIIDTRNMFCEEFDRHKNYMRIGKR